MADRISGRDLDQGAPMRDELVDAAAIAAHDRQRRLPADARRALRSGLCAHLRGRGWCLDAGVGSGSIALPLARAGIPVVGIDLSRAMLDALRAKCRGPVPVPLVQGDLTRLPFRDGVFGGALAANVFHLVAAWRTAVGELVRVVGPGGLLLVNLGTAGAGTEHGARIAARFREFLGEAWPADAALPGPRDAAEFEAHVLDRGATALPSLEIRYRQSASLEDAIARLERNPFARPAGADDAAVRRAAAATRAWAREQLGPLDEPWLSERTITYRIYRLGPGTAKPA